MPDPRRDTTAQRASSVWWFFQKHASAGAQLARELLGDFPLSPNEVNCVAEAIANHEAFSEMKRCETLAGQLVADALYDADKFRWGPDNFTHTVWYMMNSQQINVVEFFGRFPWGVDGILKIKDINCRHPTRPNVEPKKTPRNKKTIAVKINVIMIASGIIQSLFLGHIPGVT